MEVQAIEGAGRAAILPRAGSAARSYAARIPEPEVAASWQLIEPAGVRMMHGPAAVRLLEHIPATRWLGRTPRTLRLTPVATAADRLLGRIRRPFRRFCPNPRAAPLVLAASAGSSAGVAPWPARLVPGGPGMEG